MSAWNWLRERLLPEDYLANVAASARVRGYELGQARMREAAAKVCGDERTAEKILALPLIEL